MSSRHPLLPWLVWACASLAYGVALINRSSLAALGPVAQDHFSIDATTLSMFAVIQLLVYAGLQIPVGVLVDRFGSTTMILSGGLLMMAGQIVMAMVPDVTIAILARVLVGAGDACTFISVMRLLPEWFSVRHLATVAQLTTLFGQLGQLVSVGPLALFVGAFGWTSGFLGIAAVAFLMVLLGSLSLRDRPGASTVIERMTGRQGRTSREARSLGASDSTAQLAAVAPPATSVMPVVEGSPSRMPGRGFWENARRLLSIPGVRLAYWIHFVLPFPSNVFLILWGTPFLVGGAGISQAAASGLLSLMVVSSMTASLLLGPLTSRFIEHRVWIAFGIGVALMLCWIAVLLWPGAPPFWMLCLVSVMMAVAGPASMVTFEVGRSHTPRSFAGFGTGLVNTGGFTSTLFVMLLIGLVLDMLGAGSPELYTLSAFKWAFATMIPFWLLGFTMILIERARTKRWMEERGRTLR